MAKSNGPQLNVNIGADTKDFSKGVKGAKADLKDFEKVGNSSLKGVSDAFGIPTDKLQQMAGATRELGRRFAESEKAGTQAFGKLLQGCSGLAAGLAGLGIGAAIAAFKALKAEAENFSNTIDGLNMKMQTETWLATYKQAMHDANQETGRSFAQLMNGLQEAWTDMGTTVGHLFANGFNMKKTFRDRAGARANANDAAYAANDLAEAQKGLLAIDQDLADLETKIAAVRLEAYDTKAPEKVAELQDLINQKYEMQERLLYDVYDATVRIRKASGNTVDDVKEENAAYRAWVQLAAERDNEIKSTLKLEKSVTKEVTTQVEKTDEWVERLKDLQGALAADRADLNFWGIEEALNKPGALTALAEPLKQTELTVPVKPVIDDQSLIDFSGEAQALLTSAFQDMGVLLGNAIGDALSGGDVWGNFSKDFLETLADLSIKVGEIAVAVGTAILGIKLALKSLNPFAAIGAGVALIALGSAAKAALSNAADRSGSSAAVSSSVASSSYGSGGVSNMETANITVNVTGRLQASGSTLVAVLDSENNRRNHTT